MSIKDDLDAAIEMIRNARIPEPHRHIIHPREYERAARGEHVITNCADCFAMVEFGAPA